MNDGLGNLAARDIDQLAAIVKNPLERIQGAPARIRAPAPKLAGQGMLSDIIAVARRQPGSSQTAATRSLAENTRPAGQAHSARTETVRTAAGICASPSSKADHIA